MSNQADHTIVRLRVPPELKKQIEESAEKNNRSQSAEMVARLEESFSNTKESSSEELNELKTQMEKQSKALMEQHKTLMEQSKKQVEIISELKEFQEWKNKKETNPS